MMKLQIANDQDRKESQNRERKRQCELDRRNRIFNARQRKIGVDLPFLEKQIEEKRQLENERRQREEAFAKQMIKDNELAVVLAVREEEERRCVRADIDEYRKKFQRPEDRREYDINDPKAIQKQLPPRANDNQPVGLASAQKFDGEDENFDERRKVMAAQKNAWLEQQVQERKAAEEDRKKAEDMYMRALRARDARASELDQLERECRHRLGQANTKFNMALANEKKQLEAILKEQENADNLADIYNQLTSDMLTENPDVAKSAYGKNRAIGFMYKGMNPEERKKFIEAQKEQVKVLRQKKAQEEQTELEWQSLSSSITRDAYKLGLQDDRKRKELAKQLMEDNMLLALQQKQQQKYYREQFTNNLPTDEYYAAFNTTTR